MRQKREPWWAPYARLDLKGGELRTISEDDQDMLEIRWPDGSMIDLGYLEEKGMYEITTVASDDAEGWRQPLSIVDVQERAALPEKLQATIDSLVT